MAAVPRTMQTENILTRKLLAKCRSKWHLLFAWKINDRIQGGIPDAILLLGARYAWLEAKRIKQALEDYGSRYLTELQRVQINRLAHAGATVLVVGYRPDGTECVEVANAGAPFSVVRNAMRNGCLDYLETSVFA